MVVANKKTMVVRGSAHGHGGHGRRRGRTGRCGLDGGGPGWVRLAGEGPDLGGGTTPARVQKHGAELLELHTGSSHGKSGGSRRRRRTAATQDGGTRIAAMARAAARGGSQRPWQVTTHSGGEARMPLTEATGRTRSSVDRLRSFTLQFSV